MIAGLVSVSFRSLTSGEILELASRAGLGCIEWGGDVHVPHGDFAKARELARETEERGLQTVTYGSYYRAGESEAKGLAFATVLQTGCELKARQIRIWAGHHDAEETGPHEWRAIVQDIERAAQLAATSGMGVVLEFHANSLTNSYASAHRLLSELDGVGIIWQPMSRLNLCANIEGLRLLAPWVRQVHCFHAPPPSYAKSPLADGAPIWRAYLRELVKLHQVQHLLFEFVAGNDPSQLVEDALTLKSLLSAVVPAGREAAGTPGQGLNQSLEAGA